MNSNSTETEQTVLDVDNCRPSLILKLVSELMNAWEKWKVMNNLKKYLQDFSCKTDQIVI